MTMRNIPSLRMPATMYFLITVLVCAFVPLSRAQSALPNGAILGVVGGVTRTRAVVGFRSQQSAQVWVAYHRRRGGQQGFQSNDPNLHYSKDRVVTSPSNDFTGSITLSNLQEDTTYFYRIVINGVTQNVPREYEQMFRTFPRSGRVDFSVFSDTWVNGNGHTGQEYNRAAKSYESGGYYQQSDRPLFALQIGDFDHRNPLTLDDSRRMHREMRDTRFQSGAQFTANILTKMCVAHMWDDHDYCTNDSDMYCPSKRTSTQAFREYYPGYAEANPSYGLWYKFRAGDAELFVLDTRSRRDPNNSANTAAKSMLNGGGGIPNDQLTWLLNGLRQSSATWKIIVSSTGGNLYARLNTSTDNWRSFPSEVNRIRNFLQSNRIQNVVMISGDIHSGGGIDNGSNNVFGIPEMTVPHTNMPMQAPSHNMPWGVWSQGVLPGVNSQLQGEGYASVSVNSNSLIFRTHDRDGRVRLRYSLQRRRSSGNLRGRIGAGSDELFDGP
ncbi:alkaline phosphatase [Seminavis robusta]|uniref:Alkaline phosphatase n=1 Tax=Seminavis robusta TaxID=568900 RepID=A0A9N8DGU0_9STRA|nr:alkaline phosphatase [Seminavis robusta]|eukprot:Sro145_g067160.1 alkaline phosphatase (496) ;mRNA; f:3520-5007